MCDNLWYKWFVNLLIFFKDISVSISMFQGWSWFVSLVDGTKVWYLNNRMIITESLALLL